MQVHANGNRYSPEPSLMMPVTLFQEVDDLHKLEYKSGFDGEFQNLKMLEDRHLFTTNEGLKIENAAKNRYRNILPCE